MVKTTRNNKISKTNAKSPFWKFATPSAYSKEKWSEKKQYKNFKSVEKKIHLDPMAIFSVVLTSLYERNRSQKGSKVKK